jgi:hypothetical protein
MTLPCRSDLDLPGGQRDSHPRASMFMSISVRACPAPFSCVSVSSGGCFYWTGHASAVRDACSRSSNHACAARLHAHRKTAVQCSTVMAVMTTTARQRALYPRRRADACPAYCTAEAKAHTALSRMVGKVCEGGDMRVRLTTAICGSQYYHYLIPKGHQSDTASTSSLPTTNYCRWLLPGLSPARRGQGAASWRLLRASHGSSLLHRRVLDVHNDHQQPSPGICSSSS